MNVYDSSKNRHEYYYTSVQPKNWYQWFDRRHCDNEPWMQVAIYYK